MNVANTSIRRILTVIGVAAALLVGFGAIRASAAWTATTAPLTVAPVSAETLQARLTDESARSADLVDRLAALTTHAEELSAALAAAQDRIGSDADARGAAGQGPRRGEEEAGRAGEVDPRGLGRSGRRTGDRDAHDDERHPPGRRARGRGR